MNLTHPVRRHDQPLRLGAQHGYRFDGEQVFINAELNVPPYFSGGSWSLQLWACEQPHFNGPLSGVMVSELDLSLPTPLAHHVHRVEREVVAHLPPHGADCAMVLALVEQGSDGRHVVQDFSNYGQRQSFAAPHLEGAVSYAIADREVLLQAESVVNSRALGNLSGSLSLELWAQPVSEAADEGRCLAALALPRLAGQFRLAPLQGRAPFAEPAPGQWRLALLLREWTQAHGYVTRDRRSFTTLYERPAMVTIEPVDAAAPPVAAPPAAVVAAVSAPVVAKSAAPVSAAALAERTAVEGRRAVSIQTASVEELAKVKGLNLKLAREIVKARPFSSLNELVKVQGIGGKTLQRLKPLLKL